MNNTLLFFLFRFIITILLSSIQYFFYRKISLYIRGRKMWKHVQTIANVTFLIFNLPLLVLFFWRPQNTGFSDWFMYLGVLPFYAWHFSFFAIFLLILIGAFIKLPFIGILEFGKLFPRVMEKIAVLKKDQGFQKFDEQRRIFLRRGLIIASGAIFAETAYSAFKRPKYEITNVTLPIKNLPEEFNGFSLTLVSDIHSSVFMTKEMMEEYVRGVNTLRSDLILVTGDFVNSLVEEVYPFAEAFGNLKASYGIFGVLGNHDYYTREVETVASEVDRCGIKLLRNDHIMLEKKNEKIYLLGVDDMGSSRYANEVFKSVTKVLQPNIPKILMCHRPYFFEQAASLNIDLTLSGHTHGGQIVFVKVGDYIMAPARIASPYVAGLYGIGSSKMYVSRGLGTVGIPLRINCPPEITQITLTRSAPL